MKKNKNPPSWFWLAQQLIPFTKGDETHNILAKKEFDRHYGKKKTR